MRQRGCANDETTVGNSGPGYSRAQCSSRTSRVDRCHIFCNRKRLRGWKRKKRKKRSVDRARQILSTYSNCRALFLFPFELNAFNALRGTKKKHGAGVIQRQDAGGFGHCDWMFRYPLAKNLLPNVPGVCGTDTTTSAGHQRA